MIPQILDTTNTIVQISPIEVDPKYLQQWNSTHYRDFYCLTKNGELLRPTLYRKGGMNEPNPEKDKFFLLLKYVESYYKDEITKDKKKKPHLEGRWCILDNKGNELKEFDTFKSPYLIKNSILYSLGGYIYNILTDECYGRGDSVSSSEYLFLDNQFHKDKNLQGIWKINKLDGTKEIFK